MAIDRFLNDATLEQQIAPTVELNRLFPPDGARVLLKLESCGPTGSIKDRAADALFNAALQLGLATPQTHIVEATSGAFGVALARLAAARGVKATIVAPENIDSKRRALIERFGANVALTPASAGMTGAIKEARKIIAEDPNAWSPNLFENPANPAAYETGVAPELWRASGGVIDAFVAGIGSGGAFTGIARYLRRMNASIERIAVEPERAAVLAGTSFGIRGGAIPGLGAGFIPPIFDRSLPTQLATVTPDEAAQWRDRIARVEGLQVGLSTGANLAVVARLASRRDYYGKTLVTLAFSRE